MSERAVSESNRKRWIVRGVVASGVLLVLLVGAVVFAAQSVDADDLAAWLEPRIEAATGRDVEIGAARVSLFPPVAVALEGLRIANPEGMGGDPFIQAEELRLDLSVLQLLRRRIQVDEIRLGEPQVRVVVDESGRSNADGFGAGGEADGAPGPSSDADPFQVDIESIRVDNGTVSYRDVGQGTAFVLAPLDARMQVRTADGDRWTLDTSVSARVGARISEGGLDQIGPWDLEIEGSGTAENDFRTLELDGARLTLEDLIVGLGARVEQDGSGGGRFTARIQSDSLDAVRLISLLPDTATGDLPDLGGTIVLDLGVEGELGSVQPPVVTGSVTLDDVQMALAGKDPAVSGLAGTWYVSKDSVWTTDTEGTALGGPLRVRGLLRMGEVDGFVMRVSAQPDLGLLPSVTTLPDSVTAAGGLSLDITAQGALDDPSSSSLSGRVVPDGVSLTLPGVGVPVAIPSGTVILGTEGARWSELPVRLGADDFVTTGTLSDWAAWTRGDGTVPVVEGSFRGDRFDMDAVFPAPPPDSAVLYGKLVFAALGERRIRNRTPREILEERGIFRPDSLPIGGELRIAFSTLLSAPYALSDVRARVEFGPRIVQIHDATAGAYGGTVSADVNLGLGPDDEPFSMTLTARDVEAGPFLSATSPLGRVVSGVLSFDLDVSGDMDRVYLPETASLLGTGSFSLTGASLHANPVTEALSGFLDLPQLRELSFQDWIAPLVLREGRVVLEESALRGAFGEPRVAGSVGFGGQLGLELLYRLPTQALDSAALARTGVGAAVLQRVRSSGAPLDAVLRVAGSVLDPDVSADPTRVGRTLVESLENEVESEVRAEIEERQERLQERAGELVDRLIPERDTASRGLPGLNDLRRLLPGRTPQAPDSTAPPPDSSRVPPDTTAVPDSVAVDSIPRPDSVRPDTTGTRGAS